MQWSEFKMVVTGIAAVELVRSGWILDLSEAREDVDGNVVAEETGHG